MYEEPDEAGGPSNLYVHHDILLPAFPLAVAWLDCNPQGSTDAGNYAAVGTMSPGIEIWDLDVADSVEPLASLGGDIGGETTLAVAEHEAVSKKGKKKKSKVICTGLVWRNLQTQVLITDLAQRCLALSSSISHLGNAICKGLHLPCNCLYESQRIHKCHSKMPCAEAQASQGRVTHRCCPGAVVEPRVSQCVGLRISRQQHKSVGCRKPGMPDNPAMALQQGAGCGLEPCRSPHPPLRRV